MKKLFLKRPSSYLLSHQLPILTFFLHQQLEYRTKYWKEPVVLVNEFMTAENKTFGPITNVTAKKTPEGKCDVKFRLPQDVRSSQVKSLQVDYYFCLTFHF